MQGSSAIRQRRYAITPAQLLEGNGIEQILGRVLLMLGGHPNVCRCHLPFCMQAQSAASNRSSCSRSGVIHSVIAGGRCPYDSLRAADLDTLLPEEVLAGITVFFESHVDY